MTWNDFKIFNFLVLCIVLLGIVSALQRVSIVFLPPHLRDTGTNLSTESTRLDYIPQFVLISFDGARANELWKDLREFRGLLHAEGIRLNYTFFFNASFLLDQGHRDVYSRPDGARGVSNVGFGASAEDVRTRILEINNAIEAGDEIASHTVGHFSGLRWTKDDWEKEFNSFHSILFGLNEIYVGIDMPRLLLNPNDIVGFRAPYLEHNSALFDVLHKDTRYRYDSSEIADKSTWPSKDEYGLWRIPLTMMRVDSGTTPILAMDYNHYVHIGGAQDTLIRGTSAWQHAYEDLLASWLEYFNKNYFDKRAPVLVGYHFGQWDDGLYWEVMKDFARKVCGKPEVHCGTYKELVAYLDKYGSPVHR